MIQNELARHTLRCLCDRAGSCDALGRADGLLGSSEYSVGGTMSEEPKCCCRSHDKFECIRLRYQVLRDDYGEECECSCHYQNEDDEDNWVQEG